MAASSSATIFVTQCLLVQGPRILTGVFLCRQSELFLAFRTNHSYSRIVDKKTRPKFTGERLSLFIHRTEKVRRRIVNKCVATSFQAFLSFRAALLYTYRCLLLCLIT